jgi:hypothetical protein
MFTEMTTSTVCLLENYYLYNKQTSAYSNQIISLISATYIDKPFQKPSTRSEALQEEIWGFYLTYGQFIRSFSAFLRSFTPRPNPAPIPL